MTANEVIYFCYISNFNIKPYNLQTPMGCHTAAVYKGLDRGRLIHSWAALDEEVPSMKTIRGTTK